MPGLFWIVPISGVLTVFFVIWLARNVLSRDTGTPKMKEIGDMIFQGAWAFLKRQYTTIAIFSVILAVVIGILVAVLGGPEFGLSGLEIGWRTSVAFLVGAICSGIAGFVGMYIAVKSNVRCAAAAQRSLNEAVTVALRGGAVAGFLITALSLIGVTVIFFAFGGNDQPQFAPHLIVGFGFGASFVALFAQLGGGIYTKAADVGADLVGKVEAGIPEDDPRNPAVIADLVGDNVGDCAGRGADLFESTAAENIGAMILGVAVYLVTQNVVWILFPLAVRGFGMIASMIGILCVRAKNENNVMGALNFGYFIAVGLSIVGLFITVYFMLVKNAPAGTQPMWLFAAGLVGIAASVIVIFVTQYYTESRYRPVKEIAEASKTGPATNMIAGLAVGFETTLSTALIIGVSLLLAFWFGEMSGVRGAGAFGTAVATMGMLMTCPYVLSMDTFGPITDNANGINEMAGAGPEIRKITDRLDAVGNTTKALTKGYAMVSAGLAAFLLFQAYIDRVQGIQKERGLDLMTTVDISKIEVFVGAMLAAMLVFLFSSMAIRAVGKTAGKIIEEVRRQFKADPEILNPKKGSLPHKPDYGKAVDITAAAGLKEMVSPGLLVVLSPIAVGVVFKMLGFDAPMVVAAFLMVGTIVGIMMASFMNNGGGAWDNAKKMIEDGQLKDEKGNVLGKKTPAHAAAVVGDTIGDPLKDTAGPSLHVLIKLLATITLVMVPLFI